MTWDLYIAVDPGKTSGIAACWYNGTSVDAMTGHELARQETCDFVWGALTTYVDSPRQLHVVAERFTIGPQTMKMSRQHDALEIIGVVRWMTQKHGASFELQDPATAKRMVSNDALRRAGFWCRGGGGHANDAARHLMVLLVRNGWYYPLVG